MTPARDVARGVASHHEKDARLWERQALTKLRPVAGDRALGAEVERLAIETVYGSSPDPKVVADEITKMRDRVERELGGTSDLKTGAGGVMDVEFAAQYLQLVYGHAHPALRTTSTSAALNAAVACGVAPAREIELPTARAIGSCVASSIGCAWFTTSRLIACPKHATSSTSSRVDWGSPIGVLLEHVERWQHDIRAAYVRLVKPA